MIYILTIDLDCTLSDVLVVAVNLTLFCAPGGARVMHVDIDVVVVKGKEGDIEIALALDEIFALAVVPKRISYMVAYVFPGYSRIISVGALIAL
jgi:hypothetical protein